MNWEIVSAVGELVSGVAVVISLIYLAIQIRMARNVEVSVAVRDMHKKGADHLGWSMYHPGSLPILPAGIRDFHALSSADKEVFSAWAYNAMITIEQALMAHTAGLLPDSSYAAFENHGVALLRSEGSQQWWTSCNIVFTADLRNAMQTIVRDESVPRPDLYDIYPHWRS